MSFVNLHNHSEYSALDGMLSVNDLVGFAKEHGQPAIAVTDHGVMGASYQLYKTACKEGINPLIGVELYLVPDPSVRMKGEKRLHITAIATDWGGVQNLFRLTTKGAVEGYYWRPRVSLPWVKQYSEGVLFLSGCMDGIVSRHLVAGNYESARDIARTMQSVFGGDRFWLEIMPTALPEQVIINQGMVRLAEELDIPLVATSDSHYLDRTRDIHKVLLGIQSGGRMWEFGDTCFHLMTAESMDALMAQNHPGVPQWARSSAIANTVRVAEQCHVKWPQWHNIIPAPYGDVDEFQLLIELCKQGIIDRGWQYKFKDVRYHERLRHELKAIREQGFVRYFLVVHDLYHNCVIPKGIMYGTGRGSAAGSLVCALLNITDPDPLENGLIFERFITPDRVTAPDIDMDFEDGRRNEVKQYLIDKYGEDCVANIGTYSRLKGRAVLKDVSRVYNIPIREVEDVARLIIERSSGDVRASMTVIDTFQKFDACRRFADDHPEVALACEVLEGRIRQPGIHAAGMVVTPFSLTDVMPVERRGGEDKLTVAFEGGEIDELGFLKLDVLGLKTLAVLKDALEMAGLVRGDLVALDYADRAVLDAFHKGNTMGVFQFSSDGMSKLLMDMPIESFDDLVAMNALYRPGGMRSGICNDFVARRKGTQAIAPFEPTYDDITKDTLGLIVYQEQIMQIFGRMAGYTATNIDRMRQKIAKSCGTEDFGKQREAFIKGCYDKIGLAPELGDALFNKMLHFASYAFNKAHAYVYSQLAYWCMWLKVYHPQAFYVATINHENDELEYRKTLEAVVKEGIPVYLPHINLSAAKAIAEGDGIRLGLERVKGLGPKTVSEILRVRGAGFADMDDLAERTCARVCALIDELAMFADDTIDNAGQKWADKYPLPLGKQLQRQLRQLTKERFSDIDFASLEALCGRGGIGYVRGVMVNVILRRIGDFGDRKHTNWEIGRRYAVVDIADGTQTNRLKFNPNQYDKYQTLLRNGNMFVARVNKSARIDTMLFVQTLELIGGEEE